jgi:hypothetical protein
MGLFSGLKLQRRHLIPPGDYGDLFGTEIYSGYLFSKTKAAGRIANEQKDASYTPQCLEGFESDIVPNIDTLIRGIQASFDDSSLELNYENFLTSSSAIKILKRSGINIKGQEKYCQLAFFLNCRALDIGFRNFPIKLPEDNIFTLLYHLYDAILAKDNDGASNINIEIKRFVTQADADKLAYWL